MRSWIERVQRENGAPFLEELITWCASLQGLYMRSDDEAESPMALADAYTNGAVDVALARDWSSMDSVMRAARAYKAMNQNTAEKNTPGDGAPTYTGGTPTPAPPRLEQGDVATPGIGPRLPTAPTGEVAGAAAAGGDDAVVAAPPKKARAGEWMAGTARPGGRRGCA